MKAKKAQKPFRSRPEQQQQKINFSTTKRNKKNWKKVEKRVNNLLLKKSTKKPICTIDRQQNIKQYRIRYFFGLFFQNDAYAKRNQTKKSRA